MLGMSVDKHCTRANSVTRFDTQLRTTDSTGATTRPARSPHICVLPQSKCTSRTAGVEFVVKTMELHSGSKWSGLSRLESEIKIVASVYIMLVRDIDLHINHN